MSKRDEAIARLRISGVLGPSQEPTLKVLKEYMDKFLANPPMLGESRTVILDAMEKLAYHLEYDLKDEGEI